MYKIRGQCLPTRFTIIHQNEVCLNSILKFGDIKNYIFIFQLQISLDVAQEEKEYWKETISYYWNEFEDEDLKRMFKKYSQLGTSALPEDLNERLITAINNMQSTYAKATICDYKDRNKCDLHVEPGENI